MDIYITFYHIEKPPDGSEVLFIKNGFSFFDRRKDKNYIDLYFGSYTPSSSIEKEISKYKSVDTIYCSLSLHADFELIRPLLTDKWVLGGPFVSTLIARGIDFDLPGKFIARWPTKEAVCEFADDYDAYIDYGLKTYVANIPENSDAFDCNKQISLALNNSGIPNCGVPYVSLR